MNNNYTPRQQNRSQSSGYQNRNSGSRTYSPPRETEWKPYQRVTYLSSAGRKAVKTIKVTAEGYASIIDGNRELLFDKFGKVVSGDTPDENGRPARIYLITEQLAKKDHIPNYKRVTFEQPWDNVFAMRNLTLDEWKLLVDDLVQMGYGSQKLHLKNFGEKADPEHKKQIRKIFLAVKNRIKEESGEDEFHEEQDVSGNK